MLLQVPLTSLSFFLYCLLSSFLESLASFREGYDVLTESGQGGIEIPAGEDGLHDNDVVRFNKSCIRKLLSFN